MFSILLHEFYQREKSCALHSSEDYKFLSPWRVTQDINSAKSLTVEVFGALAHLCSPGNVFQSVPQ